MEQDNSLKTRLIRITGNQLDLHDAKAVPEEVNLLRQKTFTKELATLVNRIYGNEATESESIKETAALDIAEKNNLLMEFEKLIYSLKHKDEIAKTESQYNPFNLNIDVYDDIDDIDDYLQKGIEQCGFNEFGLFKYILSESSFKFDRGLLDDFLKTNCFFGLKDDLLKKGIPEQGIIIKADSIKKDPFLKKKFSSNSESEENNSSFYLNRVLYCCDKVFIKENNSNLSTIEEYTSPLIMIKLPEKFNIDTENIHKIIIKYISIPLAIYMGKNRLIPVINDSNYEDCFHLIELFQKTSHTSKLTWLILSGKEMSSMESFFMLKYFLSKIRLNAGINSLVMRVALNQIVLALPVENVEKIKKIIDDFNERSSNYINLKYIENYSSETKNKLIEFFL
ncbi:MAG: hypothetical protein WDA74_10310 [Spirochaetota bacterium]